jgi:hypothetical protein
VHVAVDHRKRQLNASSKASLIQFMRYASHIDAL